MRTGLPGSARVNSIGGGVGSFVERGCRPHDADAARSGTTARLTVAVCSNNLHRLSTFLRGNLRAIGENDTFLVVIDLPRTPEREALASRWEEAGIQLIWNGRNGGLSYSRNVVMEACPTRFVVFVDDDVSITREMVEEVRRSFAEAYHIVGVRLRPDRSDRLARWFLGPGQMHYLGLHRDDRPCCTWGACMGIDVEFARRHSLRFREELGRRGTQLQSGDDTTFLAELRAVGARERICAGVTATHHVQAERLTLTYLLRRAFWQGRSEVRRRSAAKGIAKEWRRNLDTGGPLVGKRGGLALLYGTSVLVGVLSEVALAALTHHLPWERLAAPRPASPGQLVEPAAAAD